MVSGNPGLPLLPLLPQTSGALTSSTSRFWHQEGGPGWHGGVHHLVAWKHTKESTYLWLYSLHCVSFMPFHLRITVHKHHDYLLPTNGWKGTTFGGQAQGKPLTPSLPSRFAKGLGDWALAVGLSECVGMCACLCECESVSICEYIGLWKSMCECVYL